MVVVAVLVVNLLPLTFAPIGLNLGVGSIGISALNTPIMLSLTSAQGTATLSSVDCESSKAATNATIQVQPSIATVCVGANAACGGTINVAEVTVVDLSERHERTHEDRDKRDWSIAIGAAFAAAHHVQRRSRQF